MPSMRHVWLSVVVLFALLFALLTVSPLASAQVPLQFVAVTPCRVVDTRWPVGPLGGPEIQGQTSRDFALPNGVCSIPNTAAAYSLNVTVVPHPTLGYLTVWPTGQPRPVLSTLNSPNGRVKANAAIVPAGDNEAISVFATDTTDVVLDIDGYFVPATGATLAFFPLTPCRVADTRWPNGSLGGPMLQGRTERDFPVLSSSCNLPESAQGYSLNFTAVPRPTLGYLTVWPTGQSQPTVSTLNATTGAVTANAAIVPSGTGGAISVYVTDNTDLIIDVDGYFAPSASGQNPLSLYTLPPCRVLDTRHSTGTFSGMLPVTVLASPCSVPSAEAYVLNATVIPFGGHSMGYLSLWPDAEGQPVVSTLNAVDGAVTSNMAIVPTLNGSIDAYVQNPADLVLDIFSYFASIGTLKIMNPALPSATLSHNYSAALGAAGGVAPYTWSVTSGNLPPGLNLVSVPPNWVISGTPTTVGTYPLTLHVADSQTPPATASAPLSITVNATVTQLTVLTTSLPAGSQNIGYNVMLAATGGVTPYSWSVTAGSLPIGLSLNSSTGAITGAPSGAGISNFTVRVTDSNSPPATASAPLSIIITPAVLLSITTTSLPSGNVGNAYSATLTAIGGVYPYTWSVTSGTLPDGLHLNASTGAITGTPTTVGTSNFTVQAADSETPPVTASAPLSIVINPSTRIFTLLHSFAGPDGSNPAAPLVHASDGNFYGTTYAGGAHGGGIIFKITPSGTLTTVYNFCVQSNCHDGANPAGMVQANDGNFYGVTVNGGVQGKGTAFKFTPSGTLTTLYSFCAQTHCTDGESPAYLMQASDGNFYGVNAVGGVHYIGDFYRLKPNGTMTVLFSFDDLTGKLPYEALVQGPDGQLYGTAPSGGAGDGTVFKITLSGTLTLLYDFCSIANCGDGSKPHAGLVPGSDGNFYGTTSEGGSDAGGTVFKITPGGTLTTLYNFLLSDSYQPSGRMVHGIDGNFYGTTYSGGANADGTIFEITPGGTLITLHSFTGADGSNPTVGLVQDASGYLYGTTYTGGANGDGTVFSLSPPQ